MRAPNVKGSASLGDWGSLDAHSHSSGDESSNVRDGELHDWVVGEREQRIQLVVESEQGRIPLKKPSALTPVFISKSSTYDAACWTGIEHNDYWFDHPVHASRGFQRPCMSFRPCAADASRRPADKVAATLDRGWKNRTWENRAFEQDDINDMLH
jgi:hypothetical protein